MVPRTGIVDRTRTRAAAVSEHGRDWIDRQDRGSYRGVAIDAWRCYRAVDGPLQSALLSAYILVAVLPALLVMEEYLEENPAALADDLVHHFALSTTTAGVLRGVLVHTRTHELGSAVLAIGGALLFGVGFGRVIQLVHVGAWKLELPNRESDYLRYALVLAGVYGLILLLLLQLAALAGAPWWVGMSTVPGWFGLLVLFFVWTPRLLVHKLIARRDLVPGAIATALGIVALVVVSKFGMEPWVDLYARDYGGLGVVMAIFFWIAIGSAIVVGAASLSPALAERRRLRRSPPREARSTTRR